MTKRVTAVAGVSTLLLTLGLLLGAGTAAAGESSDSVRITNDSVRITGPGTDNCIYQELGC